MVRLSVNVNKVATIRNSRGGSVPSVLEAVSVCVEAGASGITVHPRADSREMHRAEAPGVEVVGDVVGVVDAEDALLRPLGEDPRKPREAA